MVKKHSDVQNFLNIAINLGQEFLSCGGSVHRLEVLVTQSGEIRGYETHVQATPSSLIISCFFAESGKSFVRSIGINSSEISLVRLRGVDKLLQQFSKSIISEERIHKNLQRLIHLKYKKSFALRCISLSGIGLSASILNGGNPQQAVLAGVMTVFVLIVGGRIGAIFFRNFFLKVFFVSSLSLLGATVVTYLTGWASILFAIGTLAYVVPGLLMTTAISEIVDQHYLSGSIRILKSLVVFLAMGMAYFIFEDLSRVLGLPNVLAPVLVPWIYSSWLSIRIFFTSVMILCFSFEFEAHKKSIWRIFLCGTGGTLTFNLTTSLVQIYISTFLSSFVVGLLSFQISRYYKHPSQIYSVPSILSLVPGMLAFSSLSSDVSLSNPGPAPFVKALLVSLSIVFGLTLGRLGSTDERIN